MITLFRKRFEIYKALGDKTFHQLNTENFFWQPDTESNSIAIISKHLAGNMLSRWSNFFTEDGEKAWRNRDSEFENSFRTKEEVITYWEKGWQCVFDALSEITDADLDRIVYIRGEQHSVVDALLRQLCHYAYHIGQIVYLAKMQKSSEWQTLSVPKNKSEEYNREKFGKRATEDYTFSSSPVCFQNSPEVREDYKD